MTRPTIAQVAGAITAAALASVAAYSAGRGTPAMAAAASQSTISSPAATSADMNALREHLDRRFNAVEQRLSHLEGYVDGVEARTVTAKK